MVRLGADIGLRCHGCGHRILLPRADLERKLVSFVVRAVPAEPPTDLTIDGPTT